MFAVLNTEVALERAFAGMHHKIAVEVGRFAETFSAHGARVGQSAIVLHHVYFQVIFGIQRRVAAVTGTGACCSGL